jgi:hypothetical protein
MPAWFDGLQIDASQGFCFLKCMPWRVRVPARQGQLVLDHVLSMYSCGTCCNSKGQLGGEA